jgi:molybdopterin adenylyltransferase
LAIHSACDKIKCRIIIMLNIVLLTISDKSSQGQREDKSSKVIRDVLSTLEHRIAGYEVIPDEAGMIADKLVEWANADIDVIITTGGTGLAARDVTPEATLSIVDKVVPGIGEIMRAETFKITPTAVLSRATAGVRGKCLIINLPGSRKAVRECLEVVMPIIPHAVEIIKGEVTEHGATHNGA